MKKDYDWGSSSPVKWSHTSNDIEKLFEKQMCYSFMISKADFI